MDKGTSKALVVVISLIIGMILIFGGAIAGYRYSGNANKDKNKELVQENETEKNNSEKSQDNVIELEPKEKASDDPVTQEPVPDKESIEEKPIEEGILRLQRAPDFSLNDLQGNSIKLSQYRGKIVFLNFWATWCPPCRLEMPHFETASKKFETDDNAVILAVNIQEDSETVKKFMEESGFTFNVVLDLKGEIANKYKIHSIPTTFIIDKQGIIHDIAIGPMEEEELYTYVEELSGE